MTGLMCGIALRDAGFSVVIVDKEDSKRESHMAGVCLGQDAQEFLKQHDRIQKPWFRTVYGIQALRTDSSVWAFVHARRDITNWDTFYFRLRATFDGHASPWYPSPLPSSAISADRVAYVSRAEVTDLYATSDEKYPMTVALLNRDTQEQSQIQTSLVIGADGPDSFVRSKYLPHVKRRFVGYVAWRGTVKESLVSDSTREAFAGPATVHMMKGHHCIVYIIPGAEGSLEAGERFINFLWYTNTSEQELEEMLKDGIDGHRHHNIVPRGHVRKDIWAMQVDRARQAPLASPFLEVVSKIEHPFIQVITDFCSPKAAFEDGKVLLVGDALSLYRPHTAFSGTQAAFHALRVRDLAQQKLSLVRWEEQVLRYARLHWSQSVWYGNFYQRPLPVALFSALRYWIYAGLDQIRAWWASEPPLLRGTSYRPLKQD